MMNEKITKKIFVKDYTSPGTSLAFSAPYRVYKYYNGSIPLKTIKKWMQGLDTYTLHKQAKSVRPRNSTYVYYKRYQFQIDLIETAHLAESNDNFKYLLTVIDIFTRHAFVEPMKNKTASEFLKAFKEIMKRAKTFPKKILADRGSEIKNKLFKNYCKENNVDLLHSDNFIHAPFIERFNRTLKSLMYKYMTANDTDRFIDVLQLLVKTYNTRKHRMIGMTPAQAEDEQNSHLIREKHEIQYLKKQRAAPRFKKGQSVRISKMKGQFDRGFDNQFLEEIYKIKKVNTRLPIPTYTLETLDEDEIVEGNFYGNELTATDTPKSFKIEKILKKTKKAGKTLILVKWKGYKNPSWIPEENIL